MPILFILVIGLFLILNFIFIYEQKMNKRKLREWIKEHFGKKPVKTNYNFKNIECYWSEFSELIPNDEKIDDITWNDLEMNLIFSRINNCNSFVGEQVLYSTLHCLAKSNSDRELLEKKICHFTTNEKEREEIQLLLCRLGKEDGSYILPMFMKNLDVMGIPGIWAYRIMQILLVIPIIPAIIFKNPICLYGTAGVFLINVLIYAIKKTMYEIIFDTLNSVIGLVKAGIQITDTNKNSYENEFHDVKKNVILFKRISNMIGSIQRKKNAMLSGSFELILYDYIIGATFRDFIKYEQIMHILKGKQNEFMELYKKIGEIDMVIAIASFRTSLPLFCTPTFNEEHVLQMDEIYHPLIDEPVCNTVNLDRGCIITGSNASGKSTFIKAIAINVILAQSIHTCMARQMTLPYGRIITSMAVRDDLIAGESYFIKEIKYLNRIIQNLSDDRLVICVIDEILRGTNTEERIAASAAILKFLYKKNCIAIVASHDIELTQILNGIYDNFHFHEIIQENDIVFEYKIHEGVATSKNAIKLLEYAKFPKEIIEDASNPNYISKCVGVRQ